MGVCGESGLDYFENQTSLENLHGEFRNLSIEDEESVPRVGSPFPQRPDQLDCSYYMKTGNCKYGMSCRFNHPPSRVKNQGRPVSDSWEPALENEKEELPERVGQPECKFYIKTGTCKFGKACRYHHPREKNGTEELQLNFLGLPIRPRERECPFYMRTGACKFANNCRFHHPEPTAVGGSDPVPGHPGGGSLPLHASGTSIPPMTSWSLQRFSNDMGPPLDASPSYVPVMLAPPQGVMPNSGWNGYQAPNNPMFPPERNQQLPPAAPINHHAKIPDYTINQQLMPPQEEFPERPGEPECKYFMKNGDCKFKSACRYHHPRTRISSQPVSLNPFGLPLRPDQQICTHYSRYGICKFGAACNFDHPVNGDNYPPPSAPPMAAHAPRPYY